MNMAMNCGSWAFTVSMQNIKVVLKLSLFIHKITALASVHTPHTTSELTLKSYVSGFCACEGHSAAAKTKQPLGLVTKTDFSPKCRWELVSFKEKNQPQEQLESQRKFPGQAAIPYFLTVRLFKLSLTPSSDTMSYLKAPTLSSRKVHLHGKISCIPVGSLFLPFPNTKQHSSSSKSTQHGDTKQTHCCQGGQRSCSGATGGHQ